MASVSSDQAEISYAESVTNWGGDTFVLEPDIKVQGSNSVSCAQTATGANDAYFDGSWNMSGSHVRLQFSLTYMAYWAATNAVQVFLSDGTNTDYITVYGSAADYPGGWVDVVLDAALFTNVTLTAVTRVGVRVNCSAKPRNVVNAWYDNWRFSNSLVVTSTTTEAVSFAAAAAQDAASVYGILKQVDGVTFAFGAVTLGDSGSANANIVSSNEVVVFGDRSVSSSLYKLATDEGTGNTDIDISGLVCKTVGGTGAELDISSSLNSLSIVGSSFIAMGTVTLTPTVTSPTFDANAFTSCGATALSFEATNCTFIQSGQITLSGSGKLTDCTIDESTAAVAVSCDTLADLSGCHFISDGTGHAVDLGTISATTSMTWNNTESGYAATNGSTGNETIKVNVASGQTLTINVSATGSTPTYYNTGTGTVTVVSGQKTFSFTVSPSITGYEWRLYVDSGTPGELGTTELDGEETATADNQSYQYTYSSDTDVVLQIIATGYEEFNGYYTLKNSDQDVTVTLTPETNL